MKIHDLNNHINDIKTHYKSELLKIRTGRANVSLVEDILVEAYDGSPPLKLNELASLSTPDAQLISVSPWDKSILRKIEEAIVKSGRGLNPSNDGSNIRVPVPALTEERRKELVKEVYAKLEESKIRVRNIRQDAIKSSEEQEDQGVISEDEMYRIKKEIEDIIQKANKELTEMAEIKEKELMTF